MLVQPFMNSYSFGSCLLYTRSYITSYFLPSFTVSVVVSVLDSLYHSYYYNHYQCSPASISITVSHCISLSHSLALTVSLSFSHSLQSHFFSLSLPHTLLLSLCFSLYLIHSNLTVSHSLSLTLSCSHCVSLSLYRSQYPSAPVLFTEDPLIIHWAEGMKMLREAEHEVRLINVFSNHIDVLSWILSRVCFHFLTILVCLYDWFVLSNFHCFGFNFFITICLLSLISISSISNNEK